MNYENIAIVIDTREQAPLQFENLNSLRSDLYSGDYSVQGLEHLFSVERKSIPDLVGSVTGGRDRFERELHRLRGFWFKRLLIVGDEKDVIEHNYRSKTNPKSVINTLHAFEIRYNVPVIWAGTEENAAKLIETWAYWFCREVDKMASWRD